MRDLEKGQITNKLSQPIGNGNIAGVDVRLFSPEADGLAVTATSLRMSCRIEIGSFVYVFVGRLNRDKGLDELICAFKSLPENCRLLIVGDVDKTAPISNKLIRIIQSHPRIHWLGFQQDIRPALKAANVLVLPSYREGFPNVVLQAGAMALPVIATNVNGCVEVIQPGLNGWLVPTRNSSALLETMLIACHSRHEVLLEMGRAARARIVERFDQKGHWGRMLAFYESLIIH